MAKPTDYFTALILDDNPGDAVLLRQMLSSLGEPTVKATIHHSSQGLFPSSADRFDWVFLADNYANSDPVQLLNAIGAQYHSADIVLSSDGHLSAQELLAAARSGLAQIIEKDSLSRSVLNETLHQLLVSGKSNNEAPASSQRPSRVGPETQNSSSSFAAPYAPQNLSANTPQGNPLTHGFIAEESEGGGQGDASPWNELTTGVIVLERDDTHWLVCSINKAAADLDNLDPAELVRQPLTADTFDYQNLNLVDQLEAIGSGEQLRFTDVLQIDNDGEASWRTISATRTHPQRIILELHASAHHLIGEDSADDEQPSIWQHIVSSYPDLTALIDEDGSIIDLISGEWQNIQNDTEALKGQTLSSLISEEQRQLCRELLSKALNTGKSQQTVFKLELSDGPLWLHSSLSLLRTPAATQRTALFVATNVTEMFERQQSGFAELETMKEFTRRMPFALAIKDSDGRFERANPYFLDLFGLRSDDVIGKAEADLFPEHLTLQLLELEHRMQASKDVVEASVQVDPDDWMVYRFIKLPLHNDIDNNLASCLLVLPSDGEDQISTSVPSSKKAATKRATGIDSKKKSPRLKTSKP